MVFCSIFYLFGSDRKGFVEHCCVDGTWFFSEQWFFNFQCDFPSPSLLHTPRTQSVHKSFCSSRLAGKKLCHDLLAVKMSDFSPRTENLSLFWVGWVEVWGKEQQQTVKSGLTPIIQFSKPVRRLSAKAVLIFGINLFIIIANATCGTRTVDIILHVAKWSHLSRVDWLGINYEWWDNFFIQIYKCFDYSYINYTFLIHKDIDSGKTIVILQSDIVQKRCQIPSDTQNSFV